MSGSKVGNGSPDSTADLPDPLAAMLVGPNGADTVPAEVMAATAAWLTAATLTARMTAGAH